MSCTGMLVLCRRREHTHTHSVNMSEGVCASFHHMHVHSTWIGRNSSHRRNSPTRVRLRLLPYLKCPHYVCCYVRYITEKLAHVPISILCASQEVSMICIWDHGTCFTIFAISRKNLCMHQEAMCSHLSHQESQT